MADEVVNEITCEFYAQALINEEFLGMTEKHSPNDFYDWKTTIVFYCSLHYLKSYAKTVGISLGNHDDTFSKLYSQEQGVRPELVIDTDIRKLYKILFGHSRSSRYDGYANQNMQLKIAKMRLKDDKVYLEKMKGYFCEKIQAHYQ